MCWTGMQSHQRLAPRYAGTEPFSHFLRAALARHEKAGAVPVTAQPDAPRIDLGRAGESGTEERSEQVVTSFAGRPVIDHHHHRAAPPFHEELAESSDSELSAQMFRNSIDPRSFRIGPGSLKATGDRIANGLSGGSRERGSSIGPRRAA
jgi:hypothetical protein